jgi:hypothetical protein
MLEVKIADGNRRSWAPNHIVCISNQSGGGRDPQNLSRQEVSVVLSTSLKRATMPTAPGTQ